MPRTYLANKQISTTPNHYNRHKFLNLYSDDTINPGPNSFILYGLFLTKDSPATTQFNHGNERHIPVIFRTETRARTLYDKCNSHQNIKNFEDAIKRLTS